MNCNRGSTGPQKESQRNAPSLTRRPSKSTAAALDADIRQSDVEASFGLGLQLITIRTLATNLGLAGVTEPCLLMLLRALNIPVLHLGPNRFVDFAEFVLTLKAALSEGSDDLYIPIPRPNSKRPYAAPRDCRHRTSLPVGTVASALPSICQRILASREISGAPAQTLKSVRTWLSTAADRITMSSTPPPPLVQVPPTKSRHIPLQSLAENPPPCSI